MILIGACVVAAPALAQTPMPYPRGEFVDFSMDSGFQDNLADQAEVLFDGTVHVDNASWIRLYFTDTVINSGIEASQSGYIRITSALDNEVQELNDADLQMWNDTSAYFNGDTLYVELIGAPGSTGNRVAIAYVAVEYPVEGGTAGSCGICNTDDRVPSNVDWTARTLPVGCTASVYNEQSCMVTAGHCSDGAGDQVAQFRVPASNGDCSLNNPPVAEQFPVTGRIFTNGGIGNDWSVLTTGTNNLGQKPFDRYGVFIPIAAAPANVNDVASITGYGVDDQCTRTQIQQTHTGRITQVLGNHYRYLIDMTFGNSGSDVVVNGQCVAINTHCQNVQCPENFGTRVDLAAFVNARQQLCGQGGEGACCLPGDTCVQATRTECADRGGRYQGDGSDCRNVQCGSDCCQNLKWDNDIRPNGVNGRAVSPPSFPDIRVVDDFLVEEDCRIDCVQANVIEDGGWTPGNSVTVTVRRHDAGSGGPVPGAGGIVTSVQSPFARTATGDQYFGRNDYDYCIQLGNNSFNLAAGHYWVGIRNAGGGGTGTNYWMTSDGGQQGTSTGWFSLDAGATFTDEGPTWHHAFEIGGTPIGGPEGACCLPNGECVQASPQECRDRQGRYQGDNTDCREVDCTPRGACCRGDECVIAPREECLPCEQCDTCEGDIDCDGQVNPVDSGLCQSLFGSRRPQDLCICDIDCDGQINPVDSGLIQSLFGTCNPPTPFCPGFGDYQGDGTDCDPNPCGQDLGACCLPGGGGGCDWDNGLVPNGVNGRALSPPSFPDIRVADDFVADTGCKIVSVHANVIEDGGWTNGGEITVEVRANSGGAPGAIVGSHVGSFTRMATGDSYFGRADYDYWVEGMSINLGAGTYWLTLRNHLGGGAGTNYWMTSDGGADGPGSSTGFFSLDAGATWAPEGDTWDHAFEIVSAGGGGDCIDTNSQDCARRQGEFHPNATCADDPCGGGGGCPWDNGMVPNGVNGRAVSPPSFPDIRVADDFVFRTQCAITSFHANVIEDGGWTHGGSVTVEVRANSGGAPGAIVGSHVGGFTRMATGDSYFGRADYDYWVEGMNINLGAGVYWIGLRNQLGGGAGTNYWMTSDGGADGAGSSTGFFSLDAGATWAAEGDTWHHAFEINP
jgi:V8-like Glu-specific endopeptidase